LCIFLTLLAVNAVTRVGKRVETLISNVLTTIVALAKRLGRSIKATKRFIEVPEKASLLAGEKKCLFALHRIGALICHVERVRAQVSISALRRRSKSLIVVPELLQDALPLFHEALLEVIEILLVHGL